MITTSSGVDFIKLCLLSEKTPAHSVWQKKFAIQSHQQICQIQSYSPNLCAKKASHPEHKKKLRYYVGKNDPFRIIFLYSSEPLLKYICTATGVCHCLEL